MSKAERKAYRKLGKAPFDHRSLPGYIPYESRWQIDDAVFDWIGQYSWEDDARIVRRVAPRVMRRLDKERLEEEQRLNLAESA